MGSQNNTEYRNWTIPGAGGPQAMIAPFWDDLYQAAGSKVYQKYDATNHMWIIEWSRMRNLYGGATETFEVILYDPVYHPTETGDGEIVFQYNAVTNSDATDMYATVGIENADHSDGVLYTYYARYEPGAAALAAPRAIRFVPTREVLLGQLSGTVRNLSAGLIPISGAHVRVLQNGHDYQTVAGGSYAGSETPGTYTLVASHPSFAPDTVSSVQIVAGGSVQVDFALRDVLAPVIQSVALASTPDTIGPYVVSATITDFFAPDGDEGVLFHQRR